MTTSDISNCTNLPLLHRRVLLRSTRQLYLSIFCGVVNCTFDRRHGDRKATS